jgi:hypothetical protein
LASDTTEIIKHSVTAGDQQEYNGAPTSLNYYFPFGNNSAQKLLPELPAYWSPSRDYVLRRAVFAESHWATAMGIGIAKMASQTWEITSKVPLKAKRGQELFLSANGGQGWTNYLKKHLRAYLSCDNGAFTEVVRQSGAPGSKVLGFIHLDSHRCRRTGDPEIPVVYRDLRGAEHEMKYYQVFDVADDSDDGDSYFGVGLCATSRAYNVIRRLAVMEQYVYEKVSGARPLNLHFITGITEKQLQDALASQEAERKRRGGVAYGGAVLIPFMQKEGISHVDIPIQSLPDNFDREKELSGALLAYANAIGLDPQDLQPLSNQQIGAGAQSQVLADKASGKGLAMWRQEWSHKGNDYVLDTATTFAFHEKDFRDELQKANISTAQATFVDMLIQDGTITAPEGKQFLVEADALPKHFMPDVPLATEILSDNEKPDLDPPAGDQVAPAPAAAAVPGQVNPQQAVQALMQPQPVATTKEFKEWQDEMLAAVPV